MTLPVEHFPKHCQMAESEALKACIEPAIDALAEYIYGDVARLNDALAIAQETLKQFPYRHEAHAFLQLVQLFKGGTP
jgi:hypothetical protein